MHKNYPLTFLLVIFTIWNNWYRDFDTQLETLAEGLAQCAGKGGKTKVVVCGFGTLLVKLWFYQVPQRKRRIYSRNLNL